MEIGKIKISTTHLVVLLAVLCVLLAFVVYIVNQPKTDFTNGNNGKLVLVQSQTVAVYQTQNSKDPSYELHISVDKSKTVKLPIVFRRNGVDANLSGAEKTQAIDTWLKSRAIDNAGFAEFPPPETGKGPYVPFNYITNKVN